MFIYHSEPNPVRVTVVGRVDEESGELKTAVARCCAKDSFRKKTQHISARPAFTVQTKNGPKTIPARPAKIIKGGVQIAYDRLVSGQIFAIFPMKKCSKYQFEHIAEGLAKQAIEDLKLVEESKKNYGK